jgi:hypothetical protein
MGLKKFIGAEAFDASPARSTSGPPSAPASTARSRSAPSRASRRTRRARTGSRSSSPTSSRRPSAPATARGPPARAAASRKWFESLMRAIATALSKLGVRPSALTTDEVVALARGALETSLSRHGEKPSGDGKEVALFVRDVSEEHSAVTRAARCASGRSRAGRGAAHPAACRRREDRQGNSRRPTTSCIEKVGGFIPEKVKAGVVATTGCRRPSSTGATPCSGISAASCARCRALLDKMSTLTRAEARVLYEAATTADPARSPCSPKRSTRVEGDAARDQGVGARARQEEVRLGQLSKESFERNEWAYLHRSYESTSSADAAGEGGARPRDPAVGRQLQGAGHRGRGGRRPAAQGE